MEHLRTHLRTLQELIDENKEHFPENDYLKSMNALKALFDEFNDETDTDDDFDPVDVLNAIRDIERERRETEQRREIERRRREIPQIPDPNLPRQRRDLHIPLFSSMEARQRWIEQYNRHECEFCGYILRNRSQLLRHQAGGLCQRLRNEPRTMPMYRY